MENLSFLYYLTWPWEACMSDLQGLSLISILCTFPHHVHMHRKFLFYTIFRNFEFIPILFSWKRTLMSPEGKVRPSYASFKASCSTRSMNSVTTLWLFFAAELEEYFSEEVQSLVFSFVNESRLMFIDLMESELGFYVKGLGQCETDLVMLFLRRIFILKIFHDIRFNPLAFFVFLLISRADHALFCSSTLFSTTFGIMR